jgi:hypothetical protein
MVRHDHRADGTDKAGRLLSITIRIGPDGAVYFQDITAKVAAVALALNPHDADLRKRLRAASAAPQEPTP